MKIDGNRWAEKFKEAGLDSDKVWQKSFEQVRNFEKKNGRCPNHNDGKLGWWCITQRQHKRKRRLSEEHVKKLGSIPGWKWNIYVAIWQKSYEEVKGFVEKNGKYPKWSEGKMGKWCCVQRMEHRKKRLSEERVNLLGELSGWKWDVYGEIWQESFEQVRDFEKKNGRCLNRGRGKLGDWCCWQRRQKKKDKLSKEQVRLLETIPSWRW